MPNYNVTITISADVEGFSYEDSYEDVFEEEMQDMDEGDAFGQTTGNPFYQYSFNEIIFNELDISRGIEQRGDDFFCWAEMCGERREKLLPCSATDGTTIESFAHDVDAIMGEAFALFDVSFSIEFSEVFDEEE